MKQQKKKRPFKISKKMEAAVLILVDGDFFELREVADQVGCCRQTLWRWRKNPEFLKLYEKQHRAMIRDVRRSFQQTTRKQLERDLHGPDPVKAHSAAIRILDMFF